MVEEEFILKTIKNVAIVKKLQCAAVFIAVPVCEGLYTEHCARNLEAIRLTPLDHIVFQFSEFFRL